MDKDGKVRGNTARTLKQALQDRVEGKSFKAAPTLKQRRLANKHSLLALDAALLHGLGLNGLADFRSDGPPWRQTAEEKLDFIEATDLPEALQATLCGRRGRYIF